MSRVLYIAQYAVTPDQPGGVRHWMHARALAEAGHDVTLITSQVQHQERTVAAGMRGRAIVRRRTEGIDVMLCRATAGYGRDIRSRVANMASFAWWAAVAAMRAPRPDVVVASSPPLPVAAVGTLVAALRRARLVLEVRDLWPESAVATGLLTSRSAIAAMNLVAGVGYRRADRLVALTDGIRDGLVARGVAPESVEVITNGVDPPPAGVPAPDIPLRDGDLVAMFMGQHATYCALPTVLDAAERLRGERDVRFVLVGGGDVKADLEDSARRRSLDNVVFAGPVPKRDVPGWLARADVCLISYRDHPLFAGALPNKTFDYLGAGKPVVAAAPGGELTRLLRDAGCGIVVPPEDGAALARAVATVVRDPALADRLGAAGRRLVRERYDRRALAARLVAVVESVA